MKAKVLSEKYQISYTNKGKEVTEDVKYSDAYWRAFQIAGTLHCRVDIQRITIVETPDEFKNSLWASFTKTNKTTNVLSGIVTIDAEHFATDTKLSRYHPNNGWVIPEYIDDFENAPMMDD